MSWQVNSKKRSTNKLPDIELSRMEIGAVRSEVLGFSSVVKGELRSHLCPIVEYVICGIEGIWVVDEEQEVQTEVGEEIETILLRAGELRRVNEKIFRQCVWRNLLCDIQMTCM